MDLLQPIVELYRRMSCELPADVTPALEAGLEREVKGSVAHDALRTILDDVRLAKGSGRPICQDTGLPVFCVTRPRQAGEDETRAAVFQSMRETGQLKRVDQPAPASAWPPGETSDTARSPQTQRG